MSTELLLTLSLAVALLFALLVAHGVGFLLVRIVRRGRARELGERPFSLEDALPRPSLAERLAPAVDRWLARADRGAAVVADTTRNAGRALADAASALGAATLAAHARVAPYFTRARRVAVHGVVTSHRTITPRLAVALQAAVAAVVGTARRVGARAVRRGAPWLTAGARRVALGLHRALVWLGATAMTFADALRRAIGDGKDEGDAPAPSTTTPARGASGRAVAARKAAEDALWHDKAS